MRHARHALLPSLALAIVACGSDAAPGDAPPLVATSASPQTAAAAAGWRAQVLYLVMPDRFRNGDPSNDEAGSPQCHDANDPQRFHGGDLEDLRKNLAYVRDVGATAIWVTPLYRQIARLPNGHCGYHGYWADYVEPYDDALEPKLGNASDLKSLIADMHASGMRLVLDMVVNHTGDTARLPQQHPAWFHTAGTCRGLGDPTIFCPLDGHPDFKQEDGNVAAYLSDVAARWTSNYGIDGIRMDTAKHVLPAYFSSSFFPAVRGARADLFAVAEAFDDGSIEPGARYVKAGFDSAFHFPLRRALVDAVAKGGTIDRVATAVEAGIAKLGMDRALDLVIFADNHDVPRFANEPGLGVSEDEIRRRSLLALDLVFTLPGIPQLYQGDEIGQYGGGDPDNRRDLARERCAAAIPPRSSLRTASSRSASGTPARRPRSSCSRPASRPRPPRSAWISAGAATRRACARGRSRAARARAHA
jgi:glycosidase